MKTNSEASAIATFLSKLESASILAENYVCLSYINEKEVVVVLYRYKAYTINVHMNSVSATFRDVIRGLAKIIDGEVEEDE